MPAGKTAIYRAPVWPPAATVAAARGSVSRPNPRESKKQNKQQTKKELIRTFLPKRFSKHVERLCLAVSPARRVSAGVG